MASGNEMPRVDIAKELPNLSDSDRHFVQKLEKLNSARAKDIKLLRTRNRVVGGLCASAVFGIYFYSMYAVHQERFLDDFDEVPQDKKN